MAPSDIKDTAAFYINAIHSMLGIKSENVRLRFRKDLGTIMKCPRTVKEGLERLLASARSNTGLVGMRTTTFKSGYKGPLPAILTAIRVLKRNLPLYRKRSKDATNLQVLRDAVENEFGMKSPNFDDYIKSLLLQSFSHLTSELQKFYPASFFAVAKSENNVSSTEGLLAKLGYVKLLPSVNKLKFVSTQRFEKDEHGKPKSVNREVKEELTPDQEFYAAVKLTLPLISKRDDISIADQLKSPELYLNEASRELYKKNGDLVDAWNKAYAFSSAHAKGKTKKTKLVHVANEVGRVARLVDKRMTYTDAEGNTYDTYMQLRYTYRKALEKLYNRKRSPKKRTAADSSVADPQASGGERSPPKKSRKSTSTSRRDKDRGSMDVGD
jgi:hypothetical protein